LGSREQLHRLVIEYTNRPIVKIAASDGVSYGLVSGAVYFEHNVWRGWIRRDFCHARNSTWPVAYGRRLNEATDQAIAVFLDELFSGF
jgi:hypothetical protein